MGKTSISRQTQGFQPEQKFLLEESFNFSKQVRLVIRVFQMIVPETAGIQKRGWNMSINPRVEVFDIIVGQIRRFEFADVEFEAIKGIE